jgi:hypothetical protein
MKWMEGWHSYENTPLSTIFSSLGAYEDYNRYDNKDPGSFASEATALYRLGAGGVTSLFSSPLQGLNALLKFLTDFGGTGETQRALGNFITGSIAAGATTPVGGTAFRQVGRLFDATEYEADGWGKMFRYVPVVNYWLSQPRLNLFGEAITRPKLNVFGEKMTTTPLRSLPEHRSEVDPNDPVWNYLAEHPNLILTMPGATGSAGNIKMTPDEVYEYHKARGPALKQGLAEAFKDPEFNAMSSNEQNMVLKRGYEREASRIGQMHVLEYRQTHPVTKERMEQRLTGKGMSPEQAAEIAGQLGLPSQ